MTTLQHTKKKNKPALLDICEIFSSVQGETSYVGKPAVFVRFSGCNLNCCWCDTRYAQTKSFSFSAIEIKEKILSFNIPLTVITGGEPLMQEGLKTLIKLLCHEKIKILIETNGSYDISEIPSRVRIIMDYKTPSSGESKKMIKQNLFKLQEKDELKFVVANCDDFRWALKIINSNSINAGEILFSPASVQMDFLKLSELVSRHCPHARVQANVHKIFNIR
ncbi:MAG: 7-carboxy-7-deazaguanine synthase QueE [Elusimicrobiota bacterium]